MRVADSFVGLGSVRERAASTLPYPRVRSGSNGSRFSWDFLPVELLGETAGAMSAVLI